MSTDKMFFLFLGEPYHLGFEQLYLPPDYASSFYTVEPSLPVPKKYMDPEAIETSKFLQREREEEEQRQKKYGQEKNAASLNVLDATPSWAKCVCPPPQTFEVFELQPLPKKQATRP